MEKRIKKSQLHLALHPELMERIKSAAAQDGRTVTNWIERVVTEWLKNNQKIS